MQSTLYGAQTTHRLHVAFSDIENKISYTIKKALIDSSLTINKGFFSYSSSVSFSIA